MALKCKPTHRFVSISEQPINKLNGQEKEISSLEKKDETLEKIHKKGNLSRETTGVNIISKADKLLPVKKKVKKSVNKNNNLESESVNNQDKLKNVQKTVRFKKKVKKRLIQSNK